MLKIIIIPEGIPLWDNQMLPHSTPIQAIYINKLYIFNNQLEIKNILHPLALHHITTNGHQSP